MVCDEKIVEIIIKYIDSYNCITKLEKDEIDILISDELDSCNYFDKTFKILPITKYDYNHYHYKINNNCYDVFVYNKEDIDSNNMFQIILCNNYTEIYNFKEGNYKDKIKVCSFKNPATIFSFFDNSIIIIKNSIHSDCNYLELK